MTKPTSPQTFLQNNILLAVVFLTGGCLLVIEVVATRILSPYFGNTIYTFSSVLGTVLASLSVGYAVGGRVADRHPEEKWFYWLVLLSGLSVFMLIGIVAALLPLWAYDVPLVTGPLISSLILFVVPSVLIGMLSPYVITLQQKRRKDIGIGQVAGNVFFWSTLGSISGTLSAGFWLIPHLGVRTTLCWTAGVLTFIGIAGILASTRKSLQHQTAMAATIIFAGICTFTLLKAELRQVNLLYQEDGMYQKIAVLEMEHDGRDTRYMMLDRGMSSAMYLDSDEHVFDYSPFYRLHQLLVPKVERALVLGAGAYTIPKSLIEDEPSVLVDVVDIEPALKRVSEEYFRFTDNERITHITADGRRFLHDAEQPYDMIFADAYSSLFSLPEHMTTQEFFQLAKKKLSQDGMFIGNFIGMLEPTAPSLIMSEMRTFQSVFPHSYFFVTQTHERDDVQNLIFIGTHEPRDIDFCDPAITNREKRPFADLCKNQIDTSTFDLSQHALFTDDHAPVEYYTARAVRISDSKRS